MNGSKYQCQPGKSLLASASPFLRFYPFADGGVLFLEGTRRIWILNSTSAYIWCLMEQALDIDGLARSMAERFSIDMNTALRDAKNTIARFEQEGLLGDWVPGGFPEGDDDWDITPRGPRLAEPVRWVVRQLFEMPNHVFEFRSAESFPGEAFTGNLTHLALNREAAVNTCLDVLPGKVAGAWDIYLDGRRYVGGVSGNMVLPYLSTLVFVRACEALHDRLLFHAAVLGRGGKVVLFPAEAGSGKSTLAAALAARGYSYFSDELAVLDVKSLSVTPFPLPMSIKPGSTEILERYYPGLVRYSVHHRTDGQLVRYLSPPRTSLPDVKEDKEKIQSLVFPQYRGEVKSRLDLIAKGSALQRLARTGSSNREFTSADVKAMIEVVEQNPCYEMVFSDLEEAVSLLERHVFREG